MPGRWIAINPLSIEERLKVKEGLELDMSYSQLAEHVGRCKSVVMREAKRLGGPGDYDAYKAQQDFEAKQKLIGKKKVNGQEKDNRAGNQRLSGVVGL